MLAKKNRNYRGAILFLTLAFFIAGCTPPGPRAFLKGKKYLEQGNYPAAVEQFKTATTLLSTNAQAWNYLGVACQNAGQSDDAVKAYQQALTLDRDLSEAHFNLGCLYLGQNKFADAKTELTAYTLRRGNAAEGWLKLGVAELRTSDLTGAEKSFSTAYYLNTNNPESLNGLGMVFAQRGRAREAAQYFASAIRRRPDYANAILNLATVAQQDLHDNKLALENYHAYLALTPRPANWDAVNAIVASLEPPVQVAVATPPAPPLNPTPVVTPAPTPAVIETKPPPVIRPAAPPKPAPAVAHTNPNPPPRVVTPPSPPSEVVRVTPEPVIVSTPPNKTMVAAAPPVSQEPTRSGAMTQLNPVRWISPAAPETKYVDSGVTPLPSAGSPPPVLPVIIQPAPPPVPKPTLPPTPVEEPKPIHIIAPAAPSFPRYLYLSPRKPAAGNRGGAAGFFTQAREFEQASRWPDAMQAYQSAAQVDPGWFEAQYNYGVLAYRLRNFNAALSAYEMALAIQPDSVDARYNFALALKAAGYPVDAVNELNKVVAASPQEVRAQLALGNLYAQQLNDMAQARAHYLKVLELDPHNPQANDIRFWLSGNPP